MASILLPNHALGINQSLVSANGQFQLIMQSDGNLVLYRLANHHALWATATNGKDVMRAVMQGDGNLVLYNFRGRPVWASGTAGKHGSFLVMQDDGNVVIYQPNVPVWATGTNHFDTNHLDQLAHQSAGVRDPFGEPNGR